MEEAKIYQRIWRTGQNTDVITITKDIMKLLELKRGDTVEAVIKKVKTGRTEEKGADKDGKASTNLERRE